MDYDFDDDELEDGDDLADDDSSERLGSYEEEASYVCNSCGEDIVVPLDHSQGQRQEYVEDCPVCCNPNVIHVELDPDGGAHVWSRSEQDQH